MLIQSNTPKHYSEIRKHWTRATNPYSKDPTEGVLRVAEAIANQMPDLGLPRMPLNARAAFKDVLMYERPPGNGSVKDILAFAQARGYCAHPCEWVPSSEGDDQFPALYEPWAAWLAENKYTPFFEGVRLTEENFDLWKPLARVLAFNHLWQRDRETAVHLLMTVCAKKPVSIRRDLVRVIGSNVVFNGLYPDEVAVARQLANDTDEQIRSYAEQKLNEMEGLETKEDHAKILAKYFKIKGKGLLSKFRGNASSPKVIIAQEISKDSSMRHYFSTDLDALVGVLGITAQDFTSNFDLEHFKGKLFSLSMRTKDTEARKILARRVAEAGKECPAGLFRDADPDTWRKALDVNLGSLYPSSVVNFLGPKAGSLDIKTVRKIRFYDAGKR